MTKSWHTWLRPQRREKKKREDEEKKTNTEQHIQRRDKNTSILKEEFPAVCQGDRAPIGSGGLSLRSRRWMIKAIELCPHVSFSGLDLSGDQFFPCKVFDSVPEDWYFATIFQGINAPLPSAYIASLFSAEALWPDEVVDVYPASPEQTVLDKSFAAGRPKLSSIDNEREIVIPNGVHKGWWYHPEEMLRSEALSDVCPFLPYIYNTKMNRYDEYTQDRQHWAGIGT
jgi:hypothetical protein